MYYIAVLFVACAQARTFCEQTKLPLEMGQWAPNLKHMDSAAVEIGPVSINEGQFYVYENYFPGYIIKYIHVDNVAIKSCGASSTIKSGGVGTPTVLVVLHADANQEIRSVVDVWGVKDNKPKCTEKKIGDMKTGRSLYLFQNLRAISHNQGY